MAMIAHLRESKDLLERCQYWLTAYSWVNSDTFEEVQADAKLIADHRVAWEKLQTECNELRSALEWAVHDVESSDSLSADWRRWLIEQARPALER